MLLAIVWLEKQSYCWALIYTRQCLAFTLQLLQLHNSRTFDCSFSINVKAILLSIIDTMWYHCQDTTLSEKFYIFCTNDCQSLCVNRPVFKYSRHRVMIMVLTFHLNERRCFHTKLAKHTFFPSTNMAIKQIFFFLHMTYALADCTSQHRDSHIFLLPQQVY